MKKLILIIIMPLILNGCIAAKPDRSSNEAERDYIVYNMGELPSDLTMLDKENIRQQDLLIAVFEGLVKYSGVNEATGKDLVVPALAKSWTISKDMTNYTFNIRESAYWSDGNKITAYDFVNFFYDILKPGQINFNDYELFCIEGAKEYREGIKGNIGPSIKALDADTLEIKLKYPCSFFLDTLAEPVFCLRKLEGKLLSWKENYKSIPYSGPFIIQSLKDNSEIELEKNNNYWNANEVKSSKILITSIVGSEKCFAKYRNNNIDILLNPPESEMDELIKEGNIVSLPSIIGSYIVFNFKKASINNNVDLRKMIAASSEKAGVNTSAGNTKTAAAFAFKPATEDIIKSNKAENTKINKKLDDTLKFVFLDTKDNREFSKGLEKQVEKQANINFSLCPLDENSLIDTIKKGDYDMAKLDIEGDPSYPLTFLQKLVATSKFNNFGYNNPNFDNLVKEVTLEEKKTLKIQYEQKAKDILSEEVPLIPLYYYDTVVCKQNNVKRIIITKRGNIMLDKAYMVLN